MAYPVGQHFICGFEGTKVNRDVKRLIQKYRIGGVILFARNIESPRQVFSLTRQLQRLSETPLFVSVDQEGGLVRRFRGAFTPIPPMAVVGRYYQKTRSLRLVEEIGKILGRELAAVGVNYDFAPVVDVHSNPKNPVIGNRSFSPNPQVVGRCAGALIKGLHESGVLSCAKHFPGHGATSADSHKTLPVLSDPGRLLWRRDLYPFRSLIASGSILTLMTAHVKYPDLDRRHCATLSPRILNDLLRRRMKFEGLIVSDDLRMKGITKRNSVACAAELFFRAGGDVALVCRDTEQEIEAIERVEKMAAKDDAFLGHLSRAADRIASLKKRFCRNGPRFSLNRIGASQHRTVLSRLLKVAGAA